MSDNRKPTFFQRLNTPMTALTLAVISWLAIQFVQIKIDIETIKQTIIFHDNATTLIGLKNAAVHHTTGMLPCNSCHMRVTGKEKENGN